MGSTSLADTCRNFITLVQEAHSLLCNSSCATFCSVCCTYLAVLVIELAIETLDGIRNLVNLLAASQHRNTEGSKFALLSDIVPLLKLVVVGVEL